MTRGRQIALGLVALLGIGLLVAWVMYSFERKTVDLPLPPKGEAVYNPLYALKVALKSDGQSVQSRPHLFDDKHPLQAGEERGAQIVDHTLSHRRVQPPLDDVDPALQ